ncbi:TolC family protein [Myxococcus sp. K15C18031901]|uniref:TolC family protein n=1 Tax=Myxococcus dinghuensis TaxID=2906761 RepID=UPI0020A6E861|nr:TolC family protein [Myxococcus dinghuensis]MCP3099361.1 TolC family protein [Myxococcus dinghuensis]
MRRHLDRGVTVALLLAANLSAAQFTPGTAGPGSGSAPGTTGSSGGSTSGTSGTTGTSGSPTGATPGTASPGSGSIPGATPSGSSAPTSQGTGAVTTTPGARGGTGNPDSLPPGPTPITPETVDTANSPRPGAKTVSPAPARTPAQDAQRAADGVQETPDAQGAPPRAEPLTLEKLVERARATDSRVEEASAELAKFQALADQARWAWFPKFEISIGMGGPVPEAINDGRGGPVTKASEKGDLNFGKVGVTVFSNGNAVLPLYTFGKLTALKEAGAQGPIVGAALRERARAEAGFQAAQAYFSYQLARSGVQQMEEVTKRLEDAAGRIAALLKDESPQVSQVDTYKVRFFQQVVAARKAEALQGRTLALTAIGLLANVPPGAPVDVVEEDLPLDEEVTPPTLERALMLAEQYRPELTAIAAGIAAREKEVFIRERSYFPDFGLAGFYDVRFTTSATRQLSPFSYDPYNDRTAGVGLVMRGTFDIPIKDAQLAQARAELDKMRAQEKQIRAGIRLEVTKVHGDLVAAWARAKAYTDAEKSARRWVTAAFAAFDLGTGETRDLVDAFTAYAQVTADRSKSWFDVRLGTVALTRVTGAPPASGGGE